MREEMLFLEILIIYLVLPSGFEAHRYGHIDDRMIDQDKDRIRQMAHELVVEANYKINQIEGIRDRAAGMIGFEVGMVMGQIKEKYRSMLEIYRQTNNKFNKVSKIKMPSIDHKLPIHYLVRMEMIIALEHDIFRLIEVLENIPEYKHKQPYFP